MENLLDVKIISKRVGDRAYKVTHSVGVGEESVREFSDCNNAYAAHTVLRDIIYYNPYSKISLKTNVNGLLDDVKSLDSNNRTLTRYLRETLERSQSEIIKAEFSAFQ